MGAILAYDTATPHLTVVLAEGAHVRAHRTGPDDRTTHAERLNLMVAEVMDECAVDWSDLAAIAVGIGPGSYTGLRIGLSAAKGWCFARGIPLYGLPTLEVLLHELLCSGHRIPTGAMLWPMIDARRMEVFTACFGAEGTQQRDTAPLVLDTQWVEQRKGEGPLVVFGDGADKAAALWKEAGQVHHVPGIKPGASGLAGCAAEHLARGTAADLAYLVPAYGKAANVTQPRPRS